MNEVDDSILGRTSDAIAGKGLTSRLDVALDTPLRINFLVGDRVGRHEESYGSK